MSDGKSFRSQRKERAKLRKQEQPIHPLQAVYQSLNPEERPAFIAERRRSKEAETAQARDRLQNCMQNGDPAIAFNCDFSSAMDGREITSLAKQLLLCYSSLKQAAKETPVSLHFVAMDREGELWQKLLKQGGANLPINIHETSLVETFEDRLDDLIVLSPDAKEELKDVEKGKVYVIGGIVDRTVKSNLSRIGAHSVDLKTYRLPLSGHVAKRVLNITTVFDMLLRKLSGGSWDVVITQTLPQRQAIDGTSRKTRMLQRKRERRQEIFPDHDPLVKDTFKVTLPVTDAGIDDWGIERLFRLK